MSVTGDAPTELPKRRFTTGRLVLAAAMLACLPGCKKEAPPETQVTVQAEHPE